jgi:hypothetical protein
MRIVDPAWETGGIRINGKVGTYLGQDEVEWRVGDKVSKEDRGGKG